MNSSFNVEYIKANRHDFGKRVNIKAAGRPMPLLNLIQQTVVKNKTVNRKFSVEMYKKTSWLCGCDKLNTLFCFPCLIFGGEFNWTVTGIKDFFHDLLRDRMY
jgi:hypothetical protein